MELLVATTNKKQMKKDNYYALEKCYVLQKKIGFKMVCYEIKNRENEERVKGISK